MAAVAIQLWDKIEFFFFSISQGFLKSVSIKTSLPGDLTESRGDAIQQAGNIICVSWGGYALHFHLYLKAYRVGTDYKTSTRPNRLLRDMYLNHLTINSAALSVAYLQCMALVHVGS